MTIQQCKYVLKIAKTGSFNEAAKQLFIAQSTLSQSIKALEQELDIKIFMRSGSGVYLTDDGAEFVRYAGQIAEHNDFIEKRYAKGNDSQRLSVVTQHYDFIADIFGKIILETDENAYKFSIREMQTYDVISEIETARSDIGVVAIKNNDYEIMRRYLMKNGIEFTPFLKAKPHVFLRKSHPKAQCESLSISDLKDFPYVSYEQGQHNISFFTEEIMDELDVKKHIEISDRATLMNILLITDSYTIGTGIMPSALNGGDIVSVPIDIEDFYIIGYILNSNKKISHFAQKFIRLLTEEVKNIG